MVCFSTKLALLERVLLFIDNISIFISLSLLETKFCYKLFQISTYNKLNIFKILQTKFEC